MKNALIAEWTKLRTVRRWMITVYASVVLIVGIGLLGASSSGTDVNRYPDFVSGPDGEPVADEFQFVHQPLAGDGTITVRVTMQDNSHPDARAGVMIKDRAKSGTRYAAVWVTPRRGVHLDSSFETGVRASARTVPVWLRLTRTGATVTGYESADGVAWAKVGQVRAGLPQAAVVGFFVSSPPKLTVERGAGSTSVGATPTTGRATFDGVRLDAGGGAPDDWVPEAVVMHPNIDGPKGRPEGPDEEEPVTERDGVFTVAGSGEIGPNPPPDDTVEISLVGVLAGLMALVAVAVLFVTSEYRQGMIRTTFVAAPRRGRMLAAKAVIVALVAFAAGLVGGGIAIVAAEPVLRDRGFAPPAYPPYALTDGPVLRALVFTALFLAALGVFSVGVATILRHSAAAITTVIMLVVLPIILGSVLPLTPTRWLMHLTPAGGLATWRSKPDSEELAAPWTVLSPGSGLAVVCAYAAVSMVAAWWLLRRRDA